MINLADGKHDSELLEAQAHIWNHTWNFINSMSLKCAIQLGIPDAIHNHGKPISLSHLIAKLPIHPSKAHCIPRLMRTLMHSGFFAKENIKENDNEEEEGYVLTNISQLLLKDNPLSFVPFLLCLLDPALTNPFHNLSTWLQNDDPSPFYTAHGKTFWDYADHNPVFNNMFNEAMASDARLVVSLLTNKHKGVFEGLKSLVDVGGGTGTMARGIAKAFPQLDCIVYDLPHVISGLQGNENLKYVVGDMFEKIPAADAILFKWMLHGWRDRECLKILEQCKEAIKGRERGKLILIEMVLDNHREVDHETTETKLFFDMVLMTLLDGAERNEKAWGKLFSDAGFRSYKITPMLGLRSIIEVYP